MSTILDNLNDILRIDSIEAKANAAEVADPTILKDADIGINVLSPNGDGSQLTGITPAQVGAEPADINILKSADIGVTVQSYDVNTVKTNLEQLFTKPQRTSWVEANDGVIVLAEGQNFEIRPTANITINLPSDKNTHSGQTGLIYIDGSSFTVSWSAGWFFGGGVAPTITGGVIIPYSVGSNALGDPGISCGYAIPIGVI